MSPEQEAQLRQLLRTSHKLPEPSWNLFNRTSRRFSQLAERMPTIQSQAATGMREQKREETIKQKQQEEKEKQEKQQQKQEEKEKQKIFLESYKKFDKEKKSFKRDIDKETKKLSKLKQPSAIADQREKLRIMKENYDSFFVR